MGKIYYIAPGVHTVQNGGFDTYHYTTTKKTKKNKYADRMVDDAEIIKLCLECPYPECHPNSCKRILKFIRERKEKQSNDVMS